MTSYNVVNRAAMAEDQPEDISVVLANFDAIAAVINGSIDESNFPSGKLYTLNKLKQGGATNGQYMQWNGTDWVPATIPTDPPFDLETLTVVTADQDATNSTSEIDLFNFNVPGGTLGTNNMLHLTMLGDYLHNTLSDTVTFRVRFGATELYRSAAVATSQVATRYPLIWHVYLAADGATNAQLMKGGTEWNQGANAAAVGLGNFGSGGGGDAQVRLDMSGTATEDSTAQKTFRVTAQWSAASTSNSVRTQYAHLGLIRA